MSTNDWSVPETKVFDQIRAALDDDQAAVLATVISVEGSAYRRPGAKMILRPDGSGAGSITAGCLEDEVRELTADVLADGEPRVETWDLTGDDDVWGLGVGCNGVITVLLEPLDESYRPVVDARLAGESIGVATVVGGDGDPAVGTRVYYRPGEGFVGDDVPSAALDELAEPTRTLVADGKGETVTVDAGEGRLDVFVEGVHAPPELVVFGSGNDIDPVVELAKRVDLRVTVVSFRGGKADADRFPEADSVRSASPREVGDVLEWNEDTYAIVMTHNFLDDRIAVDQLLRTPIQYIGLMGPQERFEEMCEEFAAEDRPISDDDRSRIYTPIGLDLGGDSPYQIALSIVGEVVAVANDRTPAHLSQKSGPIHDRVDIAGE